MARSDTCQGPQGVGMQPGCEGGCTDAGLGCKKPEAMRAAVARTVLLHRFRKGTWLSAEVGETSRCRRRTSSRTRPDLATQVLACSLSTPLMPPLLPNPVLRPARHNHSMGQHGQGGHNTRRRYGSRCSTHSLASGAGPRWRCAPSPPPPGRPSHAPPVEGQRQTQHGVLEVENGLSSGFSVCGGPASRTDRRVIKRKAGT